MNIYEYKNENGKWERTPIKNLEKYDLDNSKLSRERLIELTKQNKEYDFYERFQQREDEWFYLKEKEFELIKEAEELYSTIKENGWFEQNNNELSDESRQSMMRLYSILGTSTEDIDFKKPSEYSELYNIKERINKLESKLPYLGHFDRKPRFSDDGISTIDEKKIITNVIDTEVRSVEDSIADLAKMNSLLFSCISAMYNTMTDTAKGKIDDGTKAIIDYSVEKFKETTTRADNQLMKEGTDLIDKLFDREAKIATIISDIKED